MTCVSKQNKLALIECFILSLPTLLAAILAVYVLTFFLAQLWARFNDEFTFLIVLPISVVILFLFIVFPFLCAFFANIAFYLILKKKYKLETNFFLYSVGFIVSTSLILILYLLFMVHAYTGYPYFHMHAENFYLMWVIYAFSLTSFFYMYATLPKGNEKKISITALSLAAVIIVLLLLGAVVDIFLFKLTFAHLLSILLGAYAGYYTIYRTLRLTPRLLAWAPTLLACIYAICLGIYAGHAFLVSNYDWVYEIIPTIPALPAPDTIAGVITFFVIYFISACLLSVVYKGLTKKKKEDVSIEFEV